LYGPYVDSRFSTGLNEERRKRGLVKPRASFVKGRKLDGFDPHARWSARTPEGFLGISTVDHK
jgi:hypothetical protein